MTSAYEVIEGVFEMIRKACVTAILAASLTGSAWAGDFNLGVVGVLNTPVYSPLVAYPFVSADGDVFGLSDDFRFSIASGSSVKIDFQNYPDPQSGTLPGMTFKLGVELSPFVFDWFETWISDSYTATNLLAGTEYILNVYSAAFLPSDITGSYDLTLSIDQTAPVPEPETYAMMLAGLGLLGVIGRRRKQKSAA